MKTVQEFVKTLCLGTLKNLQQSIVDKDHNVLEKAIPEIMLWINEGLTRIHTEYNVEDSLTIHIYESRTLYPLRKDYQMTLEEYLESGPTYEHFLWKGLSDTDAGQVVPFNNNVMQVLGVFTHEGFKLPLNDPSSLFSAFTPQYDVLQLPVNMLSGIVEVWYRANHPQVDYDRNDPISLPPLLYDALANYVAYKVHSGMNGETAVQNAGKYYNEFQNILNTAIQNGVINHNDYQPNFGKFYERGFR